MKQWFLVLLSFILAGAFSSANAQQGTAAWSRRAGANLTDQANAVATDASGSVYVTGSFSGINAGFGNGITHNSSGSEDIFLAKYSADGNTQWVRVAGASGTNSDRGRSVAVDAAGNVYVAGYFEGTAIFPNTTLVSNGLRDGFIAKYDANGSFLWAKRIGGVGRDEAYDVATDATGNVYVVGQYQNTINVGNTTLTSNGDFDFFVSRWDGNGNPTWIIGGGGATADLAAAVATDGNDVIVTGNFDGIASFEQNNPAFQRTSQGSFDAFVASYSAATGAASWVNIGGGSSADYGNDVIIERATGAIYTTGRFVGQGRFFGIQPTPELITSVNNSDDVYLTKYNRTGEIQWARSAGSPNSDFGNSLALDNAGSVYVAGQFQNTITFAPSFTATSRGNYDLFLARYNSNGNVDFAKGFGTSSLDVATGVSIFGGATYLAGYFNGSIQFDNNALLTSPGLSDIYVARLNFDVAPCNLNAATINAANPANCAQQLTAVHSGSASSYNWYRNGLLITNVNTASISAAEAGSYAVEFLSGNCISPRSGAVNVSVANNLSVNASANPLSVNAGQSTTLSVSVSGNTGATTITWRDDLGNVVGTGNNVNVTVNRTTSYTVQVTDNTSGCTRTGVVTVTVQQTGNCRTDADVVISITPGKDNVTSTPFIAEVCIGQGTGLQATAFIGNTNFQYVWYRVTSTGQIIEQVLRDNPVIQSIDIPGFYRLQVTSAGCPVANSNIIELKKFPLPTSLTISSNQGNNACAQGNVILTATATGGTPFTQPGPEIDGGYKYRWSPANAVIGSNLTRTVTVDPSIATQFTCEVIDAIGCSFSNSRSVNPGIPTITVSPVGPITVCQGNNVALTAFINGTPTVNQVVRWYRNSVLTGNTGVALTATTSGSYVAEIFDNVTRCFNRSNVVDVTIGFQAQANAGANRTICAGNSTQLGSGSIAGVSYMWSPADGLNNANIANPIARPSFTTVYTLTVNSPNCPSTSATVTVTVDAAASIVANGPTSFCEGGSVLLTVVNPTQGVNYTWRRNGFNVGGGTSFVASTPGTYTVMAGTCETNGIGVSIIDVQNVRIPKIHQFGSATLAICNNTAVPLFTDLMDGYSYQWWKDGQSIAGANSHEYSATEPGVYHVQVFVGAIDAACASKKSEGVFITRSNAAPATVMSEGDRTICAESNVCLKFHATTGHPNKNIKWEYMPTTSVTNKVMTNDMLELCVKPTITTTYTVMVMDDFGCTDVTTATVFINAIPAPQIGLNDICQRDTTSIPAPSGYTFWRLWTRTVNPNQEGVTDINPAFTPIEASVNFANEWKIAAAPNLGANLKQQYVLETSVEGCGMQYSNIATLNVRPNPTITVSGGGRSFCENNVQEVTLTANVSAGTYAGISGGTTSIVWNGTDIVSQTGNTIRVRPSATGVYTYTAMVTNGQNCSAEASATVTVIGRPDPIVFGGGVFCQGTSATITLTNPAEGYSIQWERSTTGTGNFGVVAGNTATLTTNQAGFYRARLSNAVCGNSFVSNVSDQVSFIPVPTVAADARRKAICWGEPIELFATSSITPTLPSGQSYTISWTDFNGNFITSNLGSRSAPNPVNLGTGSYPDSAANKTYNYTLTVTHPNGCTFSTIVPINLVKRGPVANATADKPMICEGTDVFLTGMNSGQLSSEMDNTYIPNLPASYRYVHYRWNGPATPGNPTGLLASGNLERNGVAEPTMVDNRTIAPLKVNPTTTTTYTLTLTSGLSECVATCEVTVRVGARLVATVLNQTGNENLCMGPVALEAICNSTTPGVQFQWYADINGQNMWVPIPGQTGKIYRPTAGGRYNVKVWLPGMEACYDYGDRWHTIVGVDGNSAQSNDLVTVWKDGDAVVQKEPAIVCAGDKIEMTARYIFGAAYQWYSITGPKGREQYTLIDGAINRKYATGTSGKYVVNVIAGCDTCPDACEIWSQVCPVVVLQELKPTVMHNGQIELCNGAFVELYTQGTESQYAYQWYMNGTAIDGETRSRIITRTNGRYTVEVRPRFTPVSTKYCRAMSENAVDVKPCSTGFCPKPISVRGVLNPDMPTMGQIRWDQPLNSSLYNLTGTYYVTLTQGSTVIFADRRVTNATFLNVTDLIPSTDYSVCVRTECTRPELRSDAQCGTFRTYAGTVTPPPTACPDLNQTNDIRTIGRTSTSLDIEWDAVADVENNLFGYRVEVTTQNDQLVSTINIDRPANYPIDPIATATTITGLSCNTVYIVYVRPRCANDVKERQTSNVVQTLDCSNGSVNDDLPIAIFITDLDDNSVNVGWTALAGADSYDVRWRLAGSGIDLGTSNETNTSLVIAGLDPNTTYEVSVRPNFTGRTTAFSAPLFFTTRARATCDRPRVSSVEGNCVNGSHEFVINWLDPASEPGLGYQINWRRRGDANVIESSLLPPTSRSETIGGMLVDNEIFDVDVIAICDNVTRDSVSIVIFTRNCSGGKLANTTANALVNYNIYPNPTNGVYNVSFSAKEANAVTLRMVDATGRIVYNQTVNAVVGENIIPVNANVSAGIYMLQIQNGSTMNTAKIVVE